MSELRGEGLGLRAPKSERWLVRGLDLRIATGAVTVLVGPNGSGKTTLMRALLGLTAPAQGRVLLDGAPLTAHPRRHRARTLAWLPQRTALPWGMAVESLVALGRTPHLSALSGPGDGDRRAVESALERVGVAHLRRRDARTLSGGELQRVLLARLLATEAPVLILDEPTTALDVGHALDLLELVRSLAHESERAVFMSLHELDWARRYGDQAVLLRGDAEGGHASGAADTVLDPESLAQVFDVDVELREGRLRFSPRARS